MTDNSQIEHRKVTHADSEDVEFREVSEEEDGVFEIRMPIATTGEVRNKGDDPLKRAELDGMRRQIEDRALPVFVDHGESSLGGQVPYSATEKIGEWTDPDIVPHDDEDTAQLEATARLMDPETLPAAAKSIREALAAIKEQTKRGMALSSSIGWREDDAYPGGNDLMEASIVGIGADPRTTTASAPIQAVSRAAMDAGADPEKLVEKVKRAIKQQTESRSKREDTEEERPFGPPNAPDLWDSWEQCIDEVEDWENVDDAEAFCGWAKDQTEGQLQSQENEMTEDNESSEEDTTEKQNSEDEDTEKRAPADVGFVDIADFVAPHLEGADVSDIESLTEEYSYVGEVDVSELATLVSITVGKPEGDILEELNEMLEESGEREGEEEEGEDEDEGEEDMQDGDTDETQDADLRDEVQSLREELEEIRSGEKDIESPQEERSDDSGGNPETETETETETRVSNKEYF